MLPRAAFISALLLTLAACAPSAVDGVTRARAKTSGPFGMITADAVKVDTARGFKGLDRVMVGSFIVGFSVLDTATAKSGRYGSAARSTLVGIDDSVMRRITDDAYASFTQGLKAAGYTVVDPAPLLSDPKFAGTKSYPVPYVDDSGGIFGARSTIHYLAPSSVPALKIFQGDIPGTLGGFAMDNPLPAAINYAQASGVKVLHAVYVLNFVSDARPTGLVLANVATVGQGVSAAADVTKVGVLADMGSFGSNNGTVSLGQPVTSEREFATVANITTSGALAGEAVGNVMLGLMGAGGSQSRSFAFTARPGDYAAAARDALDQANAALIGRMAGLR